MRTSTFIALAFAAVVLDSAVAPQIPVLGARPDFTVLVIVYAGLALGSVPAVIAGFAMGLIADSEQYDYFGLHALALSLTGYVTAGLWDHLVKTNVFVQCAILFSAALLHDTIYYLGYYRNHLDHFGPFFVRYALLGAAYTAALGAVVYFVARWRRWEAIVGDARA
jgi:rod shape-determining protein MreD